MPKKLRVRSLVKILPIRTSPKRDKERAKQKEKRRVELEAKQARGEELTSDEKRALTATRRKTNAASRPSSYGPSTIEGETAVVRGGYVHSTGAKNPNMLAGKERRFGSKTAKPGVAFQQAVQKAVEERLGSLT